MQFGMKKLLKAKTNYISSLLNGNQINKYMDKNKSYTFFIYTDSIACNANFHFYFLNGRLFSFLLIFYEYDPRFFMSFNIECERAREADVVGKVLKKRKLTKRILSKRTT